MELSPRQKYDPIKIETPECSQRPRVQKVPLNDDHRQETCKSSITVAQYGLAARESSEQPKQSPPLNPYPFSYFIYLHYGNDWRP